MILDFDLHSPSGRLATWELQVAGSYRIVLRDLATGEIIGGPGPEFVTQGPRWSPDGEHLAFFGNGRIYLHSLSDGSTQTVLDDDHLHPSFPEWSPDGTRLALTAYEPPTRIEAPPHLYLLDLKTKCLIQVTTGPHGDISRQWSPSGKQLAFTRFDTSDHNMPRNAQVLNLLSAKVTPLIDNPQTTSAIGRFCWSPDSSAVLVNVTQDKSNRLEVVRLSDLAVIWSWEASNLLTGAFSPDGRRILCIHQNELTWVSFPEGEVLDRLDLSPYSPIVIGLPGPVVSIQAQPETVYFLSKSSGIHRWRIGSDCVPVLHVPAAEQERPEFTHEEYTVISRDGREVPVHRFTPPNPKPLAVLFVMGGPGVTVDPDDSILLRLLAEGFEVVYPAYRGCSGYGQEHKEANRGEYGRADLWDVLASGFDWKERAGNEARPLALVGFSYGGFLTFLGLAQAEAPWDCGISLWGVTDLHRMPTHLDKGFPSDPQERLAAMSERSPIEQAARIRYPLLILHGGRDTTSTDEEARLIQQRVRAQGVSCDLVIFEDDTHNLSLSRKEMFVHMLDFLARFNGT